MGAFIDVTKWKRREHFELFREAAHPFFSVTVEVDVTALWQHCREHHDSSFTLAVFYLVLRAINETEALRLRLRDREVWRHDQVALGTTIARPDETFGFGRFDPTPTFAAFRETGEKTIENVRSGRVLDTHAGQDDLVYHTTLPWLRFTSFTNAITSGDSIPRITFGKISADGNAHRMPVGVEVHHALVDGLDVARFIERFETALQRFADVIA